MIVDDEKDIVEMLKYNLEKEGYRVLLSKTGEEGLELGKNKKSGSGYFGFNASRYWRAWGRKGPVQGNKTSDRRWSGQVLAGVVREYP